MRKICLLLLGCTLLFSFAACKEDDALPEGVPMSAEEIRVVLQDARAATENASSYQMLIKEMEESWEGRTFYTKAFSFMEDENGVCTALEVEDFNDTLTEEEASVKYTEGNLQYYCGGLRKEKTIADVNFPGDYVGLSVVPREIPFVWDALLEAQEIVVSKDDTAYFFRAEPSFETMMAVSGDNPSAYDSLACAIEVTVTDGYITRFFVRVTAVMDGLSASKEYDTTVSKINSLTSISRPAAVAVVEEAIINPIAAEFAIITYIENGREISYMCDTNILASGTVRWRNGTLLLHSFEKDRLSAENGAEPTVIPVLVLRRDLEGHPLKEFQVQWLCPSSGNARTNYMLERVVIPDTVEVIDRWMGAFEEPVTELYFEAARDEAPLSREEMENNILNAKAMYFAGEWQYVDGIPTPIS